MLSRTVSLGQVSVYHFQPPPPLRPVTFCSTPQGLTAVPYKSADFLIIYCLRERETHLGRIGSPWDTLCWRLSGLSVSPMGLDHRGKLLCSSAPLSTLCLCTTLLPYTCPIFMWWKHSPLCPRLNHQLHSSLVHSRITKYFLLPEFSALPDVCTEILASRGFHKSFLE